ncbi:MAG TPA: TRAP transporter large permease [Lautropia sp.]|nr:TRAP transporter large permease [Lautropia sp.]
MLILAMFGAFLLLIGLGVPLFFALVLSTLGYAAVAPSAPPMEALVINFITAIEGFYFLAIPLFVVAGELISQGGAGQRLIRFATALLGFLPGGLGIVTVSSSMLFAGMSGSAVADSAAVGSIMIPGMRRKGYSAEYAGALVAAAGTIGIIIPPSIPMLLYAFIANVSVADLFISGIVPGILFGVAMMVICWRHARKTGIDAGGPRPSGREVSNAFLECLPALLLPAIILGGIFLGIFTPTESAAVAVVYALLIGLFLYRDLRPSQLPKILIDSFITSATVLLVVSAATVLSWIITFESVPQNLLSVISLFVSGKIGFLLLVNIFLLVLGILLEPPPALLIAVPLLLPLAVQYGVDPVHLGLIMTCNLAIGLFTPPVGGTLFVAAKIARVSMGGISRQLIPHFVVCITVLLLVTYVPVLPMGLVWLLR